MATRAERRKALEHMTPAKLVEFEKTFGGTWYTGRRGDEAAKIAALLAQAERNKSIGNMLDRELGLGSDVEEPGQLEEAQSPAQASGVSAPAVWVSVVISLVALFVAVMALVVALQTK